MRCGRPFSAVPTDSATSSAAAGVPSTPSWRTAQSPRRTRSIRPAVCMRLRRFAVAVLDFPRRFSTSSKVNVRRPYGDQLVCKRQALLW